MNVNPRRSAQRSLQQRPDAFLQPGSTIAITRKPEGNERNAWLTQRGGNLEIIEVFRIELKNGRPTLVSVEKSPVYAVI